jgi:long-chain acyl-CoA synthetase
VFILDRAKDIIIRGGENVSCSEVEAAIYEHPAVAEAAVFGVPDDRLGEAIAAAVVLKDGESVGEESMSTFVAERIAKHKVPSSWWFRSEALPRNASGKFLKKDLREAMPTA